MATMNFMSFQTVWLGLALILASRRGIAFTAEANQHLAGKPLQRGGAVRNSLANERVGSTPSDALAVSSGSTPDESLNEVQLGDVDKESTGPLKVLFLSADTGGGHRASAESLAAQFQIHFPGSTYDLLDIWTLDGVLPYKNLVSSYTHLSAHPRQWRLFYHLSNTKLSALTSDSHSNLMCGRKIRKRVASYDPDVVVCVHPAMVNVPSIQLEKISKKIGRHIPFFTVVTDLGTAHNTWFRSACCDKIYVASERINKIAKRRGGFTDEKIVMSGLPIRQAFADEAARLQDRTTPAGKAYQVKIRKELRVDPNRQMVLVVGGGEGVGGLSAIVDELYTAFVKEGVDATIYVVCGRNENLKEELATKDWEKVVLGEHKPQSRNPVSRLFRRHRKRKLQEALDRAAKSDASAQHKAGNVDVVGLGFVTNMAEYMVAADVLVSKAGPGTIAEAASLGLPIMLTSFLPGQEAGNVDVVLESGFGDYCDDPVTIAEEVSCWLKDTTLLDYMSSHAQKAGRPHAAADIVLDIGANANTWKSLSGNIKRMAEFEW